MKKFVLSLSIISIFCFSYLLLRKTGYIPSIKYFFDDYCFSSICSKPSTMAKHKIIEGNDFLNYDKKITELLKNEAQIDRKQFSVLIEKLKYRLTIYYKEKPIKSYPIVLGTSPVRDKLKEGDKRTPEGVFQIQDAYNHNSWSKFLWLSYPNKESWTKHLKAKAEGRISLLSTIGGQVGIHGVPVGKDNWIDQHHNWTWGCISLKRKDIEELYEYLKKGNQVEIIH